MAGAHLRNRCPRCGGVLDVHRGAEASRQGIQRVGERGRRLGAPPEAKVAGRAWLAGGTVTAAGRIGRELKVAAASVRIGGEVDGNVEIAARRIDILPMARIKGDLAYTSPTPARIDPGAQILGKVTHTRADLAQRATRIGRIVFVAARAVLLALLLSGSLVRLGKNPPHFLDWRREVYETWRDPSTNVNDWGIRIARWIEDHVPERGVVAFGQMGRVPYYLAHDGHEVRFVDTLGLVDREVARIYRFDGKIRDLLRDIRACRSPREALELGRQRRAQQFARTVLAKQPDLVLIEAALNDYPMMRALQENPEFRTTYHPSGQLPLEGLPYVRIYTPIRRHP